MTPLATLTDVPGDLAGWEGLLNRWGMPVVLLAVIAYVLWRLARWGRPRVDQVIDTHIEFVKSVDRRTGDMVDKQKETTVVLEEIRDELKAARK